MVSTTRLAFLGSPQVSAQTLRALHAAGHEIVLVVSSKDTRRGRGNSLSPTPVKAAAIELGLPVSSRVADVLDTPAELGIVVAFGRLIRPPVLGALPFLNVHFSLLPAWRGAAPVERAILAGDELTGVCIMALEEALDTGPVYACAREAIDPDIHADALIARLGVLGTQLLLDLLENGLLALPEPRPQAGIASYAPKLGQEELQLDFSATALECYRKVRVGRAWTSFRGQRLLVHDARPLAEAPEGQHEQLLSEHTGSSVALPGALVADSVLTGAGWLRLVEVQQAGRAAQSFSSWAQGARVQLGERLGLELS